MDIEIELLIRWKKPPKKEEAEAQKEKDYFRELGIPVSNEPEVESYEDLFEYFPKTFYLLDIRTFHYVNQDHCCIQTPYGSFNVKMPYTVLKAIKEQLTHTKIFDPEELKRQLINYKDY